MSRSPSDEPPLDVFKYLKAYQAGRDLFFESTCLCIVSVSAHTQSPVSRDTSAKSAQKPKPDLIESHVPLSTKEKQDNVSWLTK